MAAARLHLGHRLGERDRVEAGDEPGLGAKGLGRALGDGFAVLSVHPVVTMTSSRVLRQLGKRDEALVGASSRRGNYWEDSVSS